MRVDGADGRVEPGEQSLRFAQRIGEEHARFAGIAVAAPPSVDGCEDLVLGSPTIDWQTERGFRDEDIAADRLERCAGRIGLHFVIARDDPYLAVMFEANLSGAEHMPSRMQ